jgi:hypothetical protein
MDGEDEPLTGTLDELAASVLQALGGNAESDVCYVQIQSAQGQAGAPPEPPSPPS